MSSRPLRATEYAAFTSLLDDDPEIEGGVTPAVIEDWLVNGWTVSMRTTTEDKHDNVVRFRNPTTQELEWRIGNRIGTVPAGTVHVVMSNVGFDIFRPAVRGNQLHPDTPLSPIE